MDLITYLPFSDVFTSDYYYDGIYEVYLRGYMTGKTNTEFAPFDNMHRQDVAVLLYRMSNTPAVSYRNIYTDVSEDSYYANASVWAYDNGIITGIDGKLGVGVSITREDFALVLYRYAVHLGLDVSQSTNLDGYSDGVYVSPYAQTAVKWAVAKGLMGQGTSQLNPLNSISRADITVMILRFLQAYNR